VPIKPLGMISVPVAYRGVHLTGFLFYVAMEGILVFWACMALFEALGFQISVERPGRQNQAQEEVKAVETLRNDDTPGSRWESRWSTVFNGP
jgi:hypothetical protein